jgi:hypothetical protein
VTAWAALWGVPTRKLELLSPVVGLLVPQLDILVTGPPAGLGGRPLGVRKEARVFFRLVGAVTVTVFLAPGAACAAPRAGDWRTAEIVAFTDFDDLEVKLDGQTHHAFLVGLRPIRETTEGREQQDRARKAVEAQLKRSELFAQVVTKRGKTLGLSIDAFAHRKHGFDHPWDPSKYPYCWSGWGAYNFNAYFLYTRATTFQDNFGENRHWSEYFAEAVKKIEGKDKP